MLFGRKSPVGLRERVRVAMWPRRSFRRSAKYFAKRALRLRATPHAIAAGVSAGVFVSFLPIPGFHFFIAALFAWLIAGNVVASAIGTAFGNPLTFPVIWASCYEVGRAILPGPATASAAPLDMTHALAHFDVQELWEPLLKPITVGAVPLGLIFAAAAYAATRWAATAFHERRRQRFAERARLSEAAGRVASVP
ncbi:MAG: DUF2062 domain-containing protein [Rhizobiaceae bacterium]|nr:DUF2062 domain-containing protein [Rhizobiaceae bacterium]